MLDKQLALKSLKLELRKIQKQHGMFLYKVSKRRDGTGVALFHKGLRSLLSQMKFCFIQSMENIKDTV